MQTNPYHVSFVCANLNMSWDSMTSSAHTRLPAFSVKYLFMSSHSFMKQLHARYMLSCFRDLYNRWLFSRIVLLIECSDRSHTSSKSISS